MTPEQEAMRDNIARALEQSTRPNVADLQRQFAEAHNVGLRWQVPR